MKNIPKIGEQFARNLSFFKEQITHGCSLKEAILSERANELKKWIPNSLPHVRRPRLYEIGIELLKNTWSTKMCRFSNWKSAESLNPTVHLHSW